MKTVMDAVNELRGSIGGICYGSSELYIAFHNDTATYNLVTLVEYRAFCGDFELVCSLNEFHATVLVLSHAPWIKGASLEEYQAADKEVLKMENKTVEVDGMVYEIGKYYLFSDNNDQWLIGSLDRVKDTGYPFSSAGVCFKCCREVNVANIGAITPAPVKLIDGEVYMFECQGEARLGFKFGEYMRIDKYTKFSIDRCANITRLIPESK